MNLLKVVLLVVVGFLFTGCFFNQPEIKIVKETVVKVAYPSDVHLRLVEVPEPPEYRDGITLEEAYEKLVAYTIKLQTTVEQYELRVLELTKWVDASKKTYNEAYPTNKDIPPDVGNK